MTIFAHIFMLVEMILCLLFLLLCPVVASATTYRVDSQSAFEQLPQPLRLTAGDRLLLKRGCTFVGTLDIETAGSRRSRVVVGAYGRGGKPRIVAPVGARWTLRVQQPDYVSVGQLDLSCADTVRLNGRTGLRLELANSSGGHDVRLQQLDIHDIHGSLVKRDGGGSAILVVCRGNRQPTAFDGLLIEDCTISRCERNAMIWEAPYDRHRPDWKPSRGVVVRRNLIEYVPGDGIVPIGCDGALIEYNLMRHCPDMLPREEAAAGFWPWSCDDTLIQYNEVSGHKAPWDGQPFDADYNCRNTTIRCNYSHDNYGGFLLVCAAGPREAPYSIGNMGTLAEKNVSINDGIRPYSTYRGEFSPAIHVAGPCLNTVIRQNIVAYDRNRFRQDADTNVVSFTDWDGYADSTLIAHNLFYTLAPAAYSLSHSRRTTLRDNQLADRQLPLRRLLRPVKIAKGKAVVMAVRKKSERSKR